MKTNPPLLVPPNPPLQLQIEKPNKWEKGGRQVSSSAVEMGSAAETGAGCRSSAREKATGRGDDVSVMAAGHWNDAGARATRRGDDAGARGGRRAGGKGKTRAGRLDAERRCFAIVAYRERRDCEGETERRSLAHLEAVFIGL